jgi:hypothetical protein
MAKPTRVDDDAIRGAAQNKISDQHEQFAPSIPNGDGELNGWIV